MAKQIITYLGYPVLVAGIVLGLVGVALRPSSGQALWPGFPRKALGAVAGQALWPGFPRKALGTVAGQALRPGPSRTRSGQAQAATGNIDTTNKWAWGTNVGWINFAPTHGGVTVFADHLEGYAWGENVGWIRLGSHTGGGARAYGNSSATDYGVNRGVNGHLSGYAWGTNVGWINFNPSDDGVTIDPATGSFDGCAWGEKVSWISFRGAAPAYNMAVAIREVYLPLVLRSAP